jgi:hypothetical protein
MRHLLRPRRTGPDTESRRPSHRVRGFVGAAAFLASSLGAPALADEPLREGELPNWIPSLGIGIGIQSRDVRGTIDNPTNPFAQFAVANPLFGGAFLKGDTVRDEPQFRCRSTGQFAGFCFYYDDQSEAVDGTTLPLGMQLFGPPEPFFGRLRPFAQGAFAFDFNNRVVASSGFKPAGFAAAAQGGFPTLRVELEVDPDYTWWAGGGLAIQMPVDLPVFLKLGFNYSEQRMDLEGSIWRGYSVNTPNEFAERTSSSDELTIKSWGPSFGLEAEVWRIGSLAMNISADLLIFYPRSGTDARFSLEQPREDPPRGADPPYCGTPNAPTNCLQPARLSIDADETQYHGSIMLRFTWLGL